MEDLDRSYKVTPCSEHGISYTATGANRDRTTTNVDIIHPKQITAIIDPMPEREEKRRMRSTYQGRA
jgi:hypothetical protein